MYVTNLKGPGRMVQLVGQVNIHMN